MKNTLAFTYCQLPVIYHISEEQKILLHLLDGTELQIKGLCLDQKLNVTF